MRKRGSLLLFTAYFAVSRGIHDCDFIGLVLENNVGTGMDTREPQPSSCSGCLSFDLLFGPGIRNDLNPEMRAFASSYSRRQRKPAEWVVQGGRGVISRIEGEQ